MGGTFFSYAANASILYLTGGLCSLLAVLAPLIPFYLPLVIGSLMSLNLATLGLFLRRVAREAREAVEQDRGRHPLARVQENRRTNLA
jgi:hypothetical protein